MLAECDDALRRERAPRFRPRGLGAEGEIGPCAHGLARDFSRDVVVIHRSPTLAMMRVVSLVPAATEIVYAIGAIDELVAVTHDDDYPPTVRVLPSVTRSTIPHGASARDIDRQVREAGSRGESTFHLDEQALRDAPPDVILGQTLGAARAEFVIAMPCGWDAERAAVEAARLGSVGDARILGVDGAAFFSRPGPRLVDGVELLASIFHPNAVSAPDGAIAVPVSI